MQTTYEGTDYPGLKRGDLTAQANAVVTPVAMTITLPSQGMWEGSLMAAYRGNPKAHFGIAKVKFVWYSADGTNYVLGGEVIGTGAYVGIVTGITVSAPTTGGVVTVSMAFSGGGSRDGQLLANLRQIAGPADLWLM